MHGYMYTSKNWNIKQKHIEKKQKEIVKMNLYRKPEMFIFISLSELKQLSFLTCGMLSYSKKKAIKEKTEK